MVLRRHVRMDARLPSVLRLLRVRAVTRRKVLRPRNADRRESQLRVAQHGAVPAVISRRH